MKFHRKRVTVVNTELVREHTVLYGANKRTISKPQEAAEFAVSCLFSGKEDREKFIVCCLDAKGEPVAVQTVATGGRTQCNVDVPGVFKSAILSNASSIICFHNHPSGSLKCSKEDMYVTDRLKQAGCILGIELFDHIIIGDGYFSMREEEEKHGTNRYKITDGI